MTPTRFFTLLSLAAAALGAQSLFVKPVKVLGDPAFIGTAANPTQIEGNGPNVVEGRELSNPLGIALDNSVSPPNIYIADSGNNRVLGFKYTTQLTSGAVADVVLGQPDRFTNTTAGPGTLRTTGLDVPTAVAVDSAGNVYIADTANNRILRFPSPMNQPAGAAQLPNMVLGQPSFSTKTANNGGVSAKTLSLATSSTTRSGLAFDSTGNLWVADTGNNRVLRYPLSVLKAGVSGAAADLVVGESDFVTTTGATAITSKSNLSQPQGVAFDAGGRLLVSDAGNRVLVYPATLSTSGTPAARIMGEDSNNSAGLSATQIQLSHPLGVLGASFGIMVADSGNNRVALFPTFENFPVETNQFSPSAIEVVGQTSYTVSMANQGNPEPSASTLSGPVDLAASSTELFVVDFVNSRVLVFPITSASPPLTTTATRVIGQLDFPFFAPNLIEGKEFNFTNSASTAILDQSSSPPHLYVADTLNNRVLGFKNFNAATLGLDQADIVIGQPDLHRNLVNYPTGLATTPNAQGLNAPTALAVDAAGNLYVADTGNSRIVRFPAPFAASAAGIRSADIVIGQTSFTSVVTDPTPQTLSSPQGIALSAAAFNPSASPTATGFLIVSDAATNRVVFFPTPFATGESATKVLGPSNLYTAATASSAANQFSSPHGVAVDPNDRVLVADTGNHRVQIFNAASAILFDDTPGISLTSGLNTPLSIATSASGFWVADPGTSALTHYPTVNQLLINKFSDASVTALQPLSAYVDPYLNLLTCDSANRVLYFAPQLVAENSASYSTRAFTPGMLASLWPAVTTNSIANGTAIAPSVPLPTALADTEVLVNGTAAPLFYVSPSQINFQLSGSLSSGGTATIQAVRVSTGQIYGSQEVQLASADPALFSLSGGTQVVASNFTDYSTNTASNPVLRGQTIILYGTGLGPVSTVPPDGQGAGAADPGLATPQILLGASATAFLDPSAILYSGLSPSLPGVWQINLTIPASAPTGGSVPIKLFLNSVPNIDPNQSGALTTTIAIK